MKKILFITPHLSTGGCPQYLLSKIEELNDKYKIFVIEYENVSDEYIVQKQKITSLLGNRFYSLSDDKETLLTIINNINPDIIHFEEMPEYFMDVNIAKKIYVDNRQYYIFETSHDSSFNIANKTFFPDKFIFVSKYQCDKFKPLNIHTELLEFPIINRKKIDKENIIEELKIYKNKFNVINIGLFTERKNQKELIEIARKLENENIIFHFIGNMAPNFEYYWKPLLKNLPSNCKIWGERNDVEQFYSIANLFYFASEGNEFNRETNPLVIREALSYGIPTFIHNLDVYQNMYSNEKNIFYLDSNINQNIEKLRFFYNDWKLKNINLTTTTITNAIIKFNGEENRIYIDWNGDTISKAKITFRDIVSKLVLFSFEFDLVNSFKYWFTPIPIVNLQKEENLKGIIVEIYSKNNIILQQDIVIHPNAIPPDNFEFKVGNTHPNWYNYYEFFYLKKYSTIETFENMNIVDIGANCGTFTRYALANKAKYVISIEPNREAFQYLSDTFSNQNNVTLINAALSDKNGEEVLYSSKFNNTMCSMLSNHMPEQDAFAETVRSIPLKEIIDNDMPNVDILKIDIEGYEYKVLRALPDLYLNKIKTLIIEIHFVLEKNIEVMELITRLKKLNYSLEFFENNGTPIENIYTVDKEFGVIIAKKINKEPSLKIKAVHLLTKPTDERELKSVESIKKIEKFDIEYKQNINDPYTDIPPIDNCSRPDKISNYPGDLKLGPGHYGSYLAHKNAILNEWADDLDILLILECDAILTKPVEEFVNKIKEIYYECEKYKIPIFSFGPKYINSDSINMGSYYLTSLMFEMHCYIITKSNYNYVKDKLNTTPWDVFDIWCTDYIKDKKMGVINDAYSIQAQGYSYVDWKLSTTNWHGESKI